MINNIKSLINRTKLKRNGFHPNTEIYVEQTKRRVYRLLPKKLIPKDCFERDRDGLPWYVLGCDLAGQLWSIELPNVVENESPTDLFMAKHCAEEVEETYGLSMPTLEKVKLGVFILIIVAIIIVTFMIVMATTGNSPIPTQ